MVADAEKIVAAALALTAEERTEVVERLLRSLDDDEHDELDDADRARLHAAMARSEEEFRAGQGIDADAVVDALRKR